MTSKVWREAASLIILAKTKVPNCHNFNFRVCTLTRSEGSSFMPNAVVFPGGVMDPCDQARMWLNYLKDECDISDKKLEQLSLVAGPRPSIFEKSKGTAMEKEIALRIAAIRETFEELGILICRKKKDFHCKLDVDVNNVKGMDVTKWQRLIRQNPEKFLAFCRKFSFVPDLWKLHEWSAWLTPVSYPKRFETAFFLVTLPQEAKLIPEKDEVSEATWQTPAGLLNNHKCGRLWVPPPQQYEFTRLAQYRDADEISNFANTRMKLGTTLMFPIQYKCSDGLLVVFPGDELYPRDVDYNHCKTDMNKFANSTLLQLREKSKKLHRAEHKSLNDVEYFVNVSIPNGHIGPCNF